MINHMININKTDLYIYFGKYSLSQKINYFHYRQAQKKPIVKHDPIEISIVSTGKCNLSCTMCPTHSNDVPKDYAYLQEPTKDINFELAKKVFDHYSKALTVQIIGSGEPLLNKDFFRIVEYAVLKKRMKVKTFSNGTILDRYIEKIITSPLDGLTISINTASAKDYERLTKMSPNFYPKILNNIQQLIKRRNEISSGFFTR